MYMRDNHLLVRHMLDAIEKINKYLGEVSFEEFASNDLLLDAVVRECEIIGEAAAGLDEDVKALELEIPWQEIIGMRNRLVHEYFNVNEEIVWKTCKDDMPQLKLALEELFQKINNN